MSDVTLTDLKELLDHVAKRLEGSPEAEIAGKVAADLASVYAQKLAGKDVDRELVVIDATAKNLGVAAAKAISDGVIDWAIGIASRLVKKVLPLP